jgi:hypothetical protein
MEWTLTSRWGPRSFRFVPASLSDKSEQQINIGWGDTAARARSGRTVRDTWICPSTTRPAAMQCRSSVLSGPASHDGFRKRRPLRLHRQTLHQPNATSGSRLFLAPISVPLRRREPHRICFFCLSMFGLSMSPDHPPALPQPHSGQATCSASVSEVLPIARVETGTAGKDTFMRTSAGATQR